MLEIPLHSPEQLQLLQRRAAAKKEVIYESHSRVEQVVERKNKRLVQFKNVPSLQIYSTYRCVRDRDRDVVAVEAYRFMHYPISVFFITSSERAAVDDEYLVRLLSNLIASDTEVRLVLEVPKALYEAAEKIFYGCDGLSCRKERGPSGRGDDERQRFSERVSVCAARNVTVAIFGTHDNSLIARFDINDIERDTSKMKKTLKQYLPAVSKVDRLTSGDEPSRGAEHKGNKPSKLLYILGVKPSSEVVLVQPDRPQAAQVPAQAQQLPVEQEELVDDSHINNDEPQEQVTSTVAQLNNATPKSAPKKSKENKFLNLFKRFKPEKAPSGRDAPFGRRYSSSDGDEMSISESGHQEMAHHETPRNKARPSDQLSVASQLSSRSSRAMHNKTFVGSRRQSTDFEECSPLGQGRHGHDSDAHSSVESLYDGQQRTFGIFRSSPKLKPRRLSPSCHDLEPSDPIGKVQVDSSGAQHATIDISPVGARQVKKESEIESHEEIVEETVAKVNEAVHSVQSLRNNTFETRSEIEPKLSTSDVCPIAEIESDIVNHQTQVEPAMPKIEPRPRVVQPAKPRVEPTKPRVEPTKPRVEPTKPRVEPTKPRVEPTKPKVEPIKPKIEPTKPKVIQPKMPVPMSNKPRLQPVQPAGGPSKIAPKPPLYIPEIETSPSLRVRDVVELLNDQFSRNRTRPVNSAFYNKLNRGSVCDVQPRRLPSVYNASVQQVRHATSVDSGLHRCFAQHQQQAAENTNGGPMKCYRYSPQQCVNIDKSPAQGEISYESLPAVKETCSMLEKRKVMLYKRLK